MKRLAILSAAIAVSTFASGRAAHAQVQQLNACVNNSSGTIKMVAQGTVCSEGATLFSWNTQGVRAASEYFCGGSVLVDGTIRFSFNSGNSSSSTGVGGSSAAAASLILQPGLYLFHFQTRAQYFDANGLRPAGQALARMFLDNQFVTQFIFSETTGSLFSVGVGGGSKLLKVTGANQAVSFTVENDFNVSAVVLDDCFLSVLQLQ
jgi:hypothetical protein